MAKALILTTKTPFLTGGAEYHCQQLRLALLGAGHEVDTIQYPLNYSARGEIVRTMYACETDDLVNLDAGLVDYVICMKFPTYYVAHPNKVVWLLHQHRPVFDQWDDGLSASPFSLWMKAKVHELDDKHLRPLGTRIFTNSPTVSSRLLKFQGIPSRPLYHPPPILPLVRHAPAEPFIFFPSRLEVLKRQSLLISAMALVRSPIKAVIAGRGGMEHELARQINSLGLQHSVELLGHVSVQTLVDLYARCSAVFYGPKDEDYGYVTLEAMLAKKPVITCTDSGEPLAFIEHTRNGMIADPTRESVAEAIEYVANDARRAYRMGQEGFRRYVEMDISWHHVVKALTTSVGLTSELL